MIGLTVDASTCLQIMSDYLGPLLQSDLVAELGFGHVPCTRVSFFYFYCTRINQRHKSLCSEVDPALICTAMKMGQ